MISIRPHAHPGADAPGGAAVPAAMPACPPVPHRHEEPYEYPVEWGRTHDDLRADPPAIAELVRLDAERRPPRFAGARIGLLVAAVTWGWVAAVDAILGEPLRTPAVLGGVGTFTSVHLVLCLAFGAALTALMDGAMDDPGLALSVVFGTLLLEVGFAMLTIFVSMTSLGTSAWLRIFVGSIIGTAVALATLARWYPARRLLERAQHDS